MSTTNSPYVMLISSKAVALLLASCISLVTLAFLSLVDGVSGTAQFVAGAISFASSFICTYVTLEFLIFRQVERIYSELSKSQLTELKKYARELNLSANPFKRVQQEITHYTKVKGREIAELKRLELYRREFIANVSHELKTPIFAAQGYILTLLDGAMNDDAVKHKFLKKAAKSLNQLDALVQDLLTLSQIESGVITMKFETFNLEMLTQDVFDQLERKAEKKGIILKMEKRNLNEVEVYADYNRIGQVLINLIGNAIKYHQGNGWVSVTFENNDNVVAVSVADNGFGIADEHLGRIFERFYRIDKSRSKKQGGTGLGLAIVKHILEGHNTKIQVESSEGEGTSFFFSLQKPQKTHETLESA